MAELNVPKNVARNLIVQKAKEVLGYEPGVWESDGDIHIGARDSGGLFSTTQTHIRLSDHPGTSKDRQVVWFEEALDHKGGDEAKQWKALSVALGEGWKALKDKGAMK